MGWSRLASILICTTALALIGFCSNCRLVVWCLGCALAAHSLSFLCLCLDGVHHLHEGGHHLGHLGRGLDERVGSADGGRQVGLISARAASCLHAILACTCVACRSLAHQLAVGLGAGDGLLALPVAFGRFAHGSADGVRGLALGAAVGRRADSLALRAILLLAQILGATNIALRLVAVNLALSAFSLLAVDLALGSFADRVADSGADGVVALPSALRGAVTFSLRDSGHEVALGRHGHKCSQC